MGYRGTYTGVWDGIQEQTMYSIGMDRTALLGSSGKAAK